MLGRARGAVLTGIDARLVEVEVDLGGGLPSISAVGLPDGAVREGIDRIRAALPHAGFRLPQHRVIVNLAPADVPKRGTGLDLPIAAALLAADGQMPALDPHEIVMAGELALDGSVRPVRGALSIALAARAAGAGTVILPAANLDEAELVEGVDTLGATTLADVAAAGGGARRPRPARRSPTELLAAIDGSGRGEDLAEVRAQQGARRALEIAAAGGHHLLMVGPPGAGKTLLARRMPSILPPLTVREALEVTRVWSAAGLAGGLVGLRPFRAPHHGTSIAGLTGGGRSLRPGEISLAHHGVLYLDELPEFRRDALEALRQPLEEGAITVVRLHESATFPADLVLVASMNPCPCGHAGGGAGPGPRCRCTPLQVQSYTARLSGPLLDRFDMVVSVPAVDLRALEGAAAGEASAAVRARVVRARQIQMTRLGAAGASCNGRMRPSELALHAQPEPPARSLLLEAGSRLGLSLRGFDRVRRVARTIADLADEERIGPEAVGEAIQYRHRAGGVPSARGRDPPVAPGLPTPYTFTAPPRAPRVDVSEEAV